LEPKPVEEHVTGGDAALLILAATFSLIGVWMVINPASAIGWVRSARPDARRNPNFTEDNPTAKSFVKFMGGLFSGFTVLVFVAFVFARYR
jgi:hypothetical protein